MKFKKFMMSSLIRKDDVIIANLMSQQLRKGKIVMASLFLDGLS